MPMVLKMKVFLISSSVLDSGCMIMLRAGGFRWNCKKIQTGFIDSSRLLRNYTEGSLSRKTRKEIS